MNLRDLRYLVCVADLRHFRKAADACHVSQPTLSMQIGKLEQQLGVPIFERTARGVMLTAAGERIVSAARAALAQAEALVEIARTYSDPMAGELRLGVIPTLGPYLLPWTLRPLRCRYPKLRPVIVEEQTEALTQRLLNHQIDVVLLATPVDTALGLAAIPLFDEPFWLVYPRGHAFDREADVSRRELEQADVLVLSDGHCLRDQVLDLCNRPSSRAEETLGDLRATSLETLLQFVAAGYGCTLVPALATRGPWMTDMGVLARPLRFRSARRRISLVHRSTFPNKVLLEKLAEAIVEPLPNTVTPLYGPRRARQAAPGGADRPD